MKSIIEEVVLWLVVGIGWQWICTWTLFPWTLPIFVHATNADLTMTSPVCEDNLYSPKGLDKGILSWMNSLPGGYYNPKQEFRHSDPNDPSSLSGIFAKERIEKGELLCRVPWTYLVTSANGEIEDEQLDCGMTRELAKQLKLGTTSKYGPYIDYLNGQPENQLPSVWSQQGQELLLQVVGQSRQENSKLRITNQDYLTAHFPPYSMLAWMEEWIDRCQGDMNDSYGKKAALMALLRADDFMMIPAYDFYNHRNGKWHNADSIWEFGDKHETRALRTIEAGEQIYISYDRCSHCEGRAEGYGTAEMFRDYGFVESFPQRWHYYRFSDIEFELDQRDGYYHVEWMNKPTGVHAQKSLEWLREQLARLSRLWYYESKNQRDIPQNEWDMIWTFHHANVIAIKSAIQGLQGHRNKIMNIVKK